MDVLKINDGDDDDTLFEKYSKLDVADELYNWLISYFKERSHYTEYMSDLSQNSITSQLALFRDLVWGHIHI